ncbi:hypothetical protein J3R30DRAFT_3406253 [Lentinula aciculospora]|uniref:Aminoglycoside phosphotransferase domain-containing protein n=1 Tax=Lentinula aciculospora TaxID=153920 RepID=A0A9W9DL89_9AGAR|nr:hypothetical protein J3R30DRAFT_3406253 [Lentinula aciculospora]
MSVSGSSALKIVPLFLDETIVHTDLEPLFYEEWSPIKNDASCISLIQSACALDDSISQPITAKARKPFDLDNAVRSFDSHSVLELQPSDERVVYVRKLSKQSSVTTSQSLSRWYKGRCDSEISVLRWFKRIAPDFPVPRVLAVDKSEELIVTSCIPGLDVLHAYPSLVTSAKYLVLILGFLSIIDCFDVDESTDLQSFFANLINSRRLRSFVYRNKAQDPKSHSLLRQRLETLQEALRPVIAELTDSDPALSSCRFVLSHQDLRCNNVPLDPVSGQVMGIVDWEYCASLPAVLAAQFPEWTHQPIMESSLYRNPKDTFLHYAFEPKAERKRLCELYEECVQRLDQEYWRCLMAGSRLRDAYAWVLASDCDPDGEAMNR